jgi:hypothetical protein
MNNQTSTTVMGDNNAPRLSMDVSAQINQYKSEESGHKAPQVLPFNVDSALELLDDVFKKLRRLSSDVNNTLNEPKHNTAAVKTITNIIDAIGEDILFNIPAQLDKMKL